MPAPGQDATDSSAVLQLIFDHAGEGLSVFDAGQCLVAWNARFIDSVGLSPSMLQRGLPMARLFEAMARQGELGTEAMADPPAAARRLLERVQSEPLTPLHRQRPDGRTIEIRRNRTPDGGWVVLYRDVTESLAAEAALADERRMLNLVLQHTEQGFWFIDNDLRTTDANPAMCRMLGTTREAMLGSSIYDWVDEENAAIFRYRTILRARGQASSYEVTLRRRDGTPVPMWNNATPLFDSQGRKAGALGLFSDISPLKAAEARLRQTGELLAQNSRALENTLQSLSQGVLGTDPAGFVTTWNPRLVDLLRLSPALLDSRPLLSHVLTQSHLQQHFKGRAAADHAGHWQMERDDGVVIDVLVHRAGDGSLVRTYTDVTGEVQAQRALVKARDEAERANRAKSDFLSRMSHELRTPLNAVLGFAQLLQSDPEERLSPQQAARVGELLRGGRHLLALINEVLDLSRIEAGTLALELAPVRLPELMGECLRLIEPLAEKRGITLTVRPGGPAAPAVRADRTRLKQVLLNLLSNAVKYNRAGGQVVLAWAVARGDEGAPGSRGVRIDVSDTGPGLTLMQQERLFQAFERLDAEGSEVEGAGIGLALSKWLVNLMRGEIGVTSEPGRGSTFWVSLESADSASAPDNPAAEAPFDAAPAPAPADAPAGGALTHTVLYIEDNAVNQMLMAGMLARRGGVELLTASDGPQGLAIAAERRLDLVLLDIQLPGIDGYEVLRRLRQQPGGRRVPVFAVSANAMPSDLAQAQAAGFDGYVTKPIDLVQLLDAVARALDGPR
jgi:PAS domain S-box-containing protein